MTSSSSSSSSLLCDESIPISPPPPPPPLLFLDPYSSELTSSLLSNSPKPLPSPNPTYLHSARTSAMTWLASASSTLGFGAPTVLLAASYLDRCFLPSLLRLNPSMPWMIHLSSLACLSLAAKMEETRVPFLLDLQLPSCQDAANVFEPKTVKRMELLILSTLNWEMSSVTAVSVLHCIVSKIDNVEILGKCEEILVMANTDWRWVRYEPAVWAAAAVMQANVDVFAELMETAEMFQISKENLEECQRIIAEIMCNNKSSTMNKRKSYNCNEPPSPTGVISSCFSYESCCSTSTSVSSSPEPLIKRFHFG